MVLLSQTRRQVHGRPGRILGRHQSLIRRVHREAEELLRRQPHARRQFNRSRPDAGCIDHARAERDHSYALLADLARQRLAEAHQSLLGGHVGGHVRQRFGRDHVDHRAAAPGNHPRHERPASEERAAQVDRDRAVPVIERHIEQGRDRLEGGVIDQQVRRPKSLQAALEERLHAGLVGNIRLAEESLAAFRPDGPLDFCALPAQLGDHDSSAKASQRAGRLAPDAAARPGYHRHLAVQHARSQLELFENLRQSICHVETSNQEISFNCTCE